MGISICPRDETSEHAMILKVITKAQKVSFSEVKIKTMLMTFCDNRVCPKSRQSIVLSTLRLLEDC
jgi:hypothetical protein